MRKVRAAGGQVGGRMFFPCCRFPALSRPCEVCPTFTLITKCWRGKSLLKLRPRLTTTPPRSQIFPEQLTLPPLNFILNSSHILSRSTLHFFFPSKSTKGYLRTSVTMVRIEDVAQDLLAAVMMVIPHFTSDQQDEITKIVRERGHDLTWNAIRYVPLVPSRPKSPSFTLFAFHLLDPPLSSASCIRVFRPVHASSSVTHYTHSPHSRFPKPSNLFTFKFLSTCSQDGCL